jgi:hypothetical protein
MRAAPHITALCPAGFDAPGTRLRSGTAERANRLSIGTEELLAAIDLAWEIESTANRELRLSRAVVALGGHIGLHSHQGDPTIVYLLSGVLTKIPHRHPVTGKARRRTPGMLG